MHGPSCKKKKSSLLILKNFEVQWSAFHFEFCPILKLFTFSSCIYQLCLFPISVSGYGDLSDIYNGGQYGSYPGNFNGLGTNYGSYYGYYGSPYSGLGYSGIGYSGIGYGGSGYRGLGYGGVGYGGYGVSGVYPGYSTYGNLGGYGGYYGRFGQYR
jgi:hypothetical protein